MSRFSSFSGSGLDRHSSRRLYGMAGGAAVALLTVWGYTTHTNPMVQIPVHRMPTPNAFDYYVEAGNALIHNKEWQDAAKVASNARLTPAQNEAVVRQNAGVVATLHTGFAYSYFSPSERSSDRYDTSYYSKFRDLARLLALQGQVRSEAGDWGGATESYLDAVQMGEEIPHGAPLLGALTGFGCQSIGRRPLWSVVEHLDAAQTQATIARLERIMDRHASFADTLQEEKYNGQARLMDLFNGTRPLFYHEATDEEDRASQESTDRALCSICYFFVSKKRIMHDFTLYMDQSSQQAQQPYCLHQPPPHEPTDVINRVLLPVFMDSRIKDVNSEAQNGLLLLTLALHAYRFDNGRYPTRLGELSPHYLQNLPEDPFSMHSPFKYRVEGSRYILYSVGPDGKDDGGTSVYDAKMDVGAHPEARYSVKQDSVGDIVAGKNF